MQAKAPDQDRCRETVRRAYRAPARRGDRHVTAQPPSPPRFADRIGGSSADNRLQGLEGLDELRGQDGDDVLLSGGGDRTKDFFAGGDGRDTVEYSFASRAVTVNLQAQVAEGDGNDLLISIEDITGSQYSDYVRGDDGPNAVNGLGGDDSVELAGGDDHVDGGDGTDIADGGAGTDSCLVEVRNACE